MDIQFIGLFYIFILYVLALFFFIDLKKAVFFYVLIVFLTPKLPQGLHWIYFNIILIFAVLKNKSLCKKTFIKPFFPFCFYYIGQACLIPFSLETPYLFQLGALLNTLTKSFLAYAIFSLYINDWNRVKKLLGCFYIVIIISILYTFVLTTLDGRNPYVELFLLDKYTNMLWWINDSSRSFGRIFSLFQYPVNYGFFIICSFFLCIYGYIYIKSFKLFFLFCLFSLIICSYICGVRTCLISLVFGICLFLFFNRGNIAHFYMYVLLLVVCFVVALLFNNRLYDYIISCFNFFDAGIYGSSLKMRIAQFFGSFEANKNFIFGNGFSWSDYYSKTFGVHPVLLGFESHIFTLICNNGFLGVVLWFLFIYMTFRFQNKLFLLGIDKFRILQSLFFCFQFYIICTGEYYFSVTWVIFYSVIIVSLYSFSNNFVSGNKVLIKT